MTVVEMITKYEMSLACVKGKECILVNKVDRLKADKKLDYFLAHKDEVKAILKADKEAKEKEAAERVAKINAIEGLNEIEAAIEEHERFQHEFNVAMSKESGHFPAKPKSNIDEMKVKYPRAAAYLKAKDFECSANYAKSNTGRKACERIINGEDHDQVLADMEKEWSDHCNNHLWD